VVTARVCPSPHATPITVSPNSPYICYQEKRTTIRYMLMSGHLYEQRNVFITIANIRHQRERQIERWEREYRPSEPSSAHPQVYTWPSSVKTALCNPPQAMPTTRLSLMAQCGVRGLILQCSVYLREYTIRGNRTIKSSSSSTPCASCPQSPEPNVITSP
jgi:hypothetical protein